MRNNKLFIVSISTLFFCFASTHSTAQTYCYNELRQAIYKYKSNRYYSATVNFNIDCLKKEEGGLSRENKLKGFKLLIQSYKAMDNDSFANELFRKLKFWYYPDLHNEEIWNILDRTVVDF